MAKKQKLELSWVGKDERVKLEPHVLGRKVGLARMPNRVVMNCLFGHFGHADCKMLGRITIVCRRIAHPLRSFATAETKRYVKLKRT